MPPLECRHDDECLPPAAEVYEACTASIDCTTNQCIENRCVPQVLPGDRCDACSEPCSACHGAGPIGVCTSTCTTTVDDMGERVDDTCSREGDYCDDGLCRPACVEPEDLYGTPCPKDLPLCDRNRPVFGVGSGLCKARVSAATGVRVW